MHVGSAILSTLLAVLLPLQSQSPVDSFRRHYQAAEAARAANDAAGAEREYGAIVAEASHEIGKVLTAERRYPEAVAALEAASALAPDDDATTVDLAIARFHVDKYREAVGPLERVVAKSPRDGDAHHMLGKCLFMLGDFPRATSELRTALRISPKDYDIEYTLALAYLKQRQLPQTKAIFARMTARLGDSARLRVLTGRAYRETGFLAEAIVELQKAVALDPHFPRVHYYLGLTYLLKDGAAQIDAAAKEFRVELDEHPDEYFANYYLGILSNMDRDWDTAIRLLERASAAQPQNPDPYFHLGQAYQGAERHDRAVEVLRKSIALTADPTHNDYQIATAHYRLGQSLIKLGEVDEGQEELQLSADLKSKSLQHDESKTEAYLSPTALQSSTGGEGVVAEADALDAGAAEGLRERSRYLSKVLGAAYNNLGLLRAERQDFAAAATQFALAARWDPALEGIDFNLGLAAYRAGRYADAVAPLDREVAARPTNTAAKQLLGVCLFATERYDRAAELLAEVVNERPNDASILYPAALALEKAGRAAEANAIVQRLISTGGDSPQVHVLLGQAYAEQGDPERALAELKAALAADPKAPDAHFYAGMIYVKGGKFDDAAREFRAELETNPADARARYHLGYALLSAGDEANGVATLREVVASRPDYGDARYELGKALLQRGDVPAAIEQLEAAARLDPDKPHVHYQLGRAYIAAGRQGEGEAELGRSRELNERSRTQAAQ